MRRPAAHEPGRVLVVDDNKVSRLLLARGLEQQGHHVTFAENGRQALDLMHGQPFDVVLLDVMMPELDGEQVLAHLTREHELRDIPVIMISASDELDSVVRCIELGAEDYLTKPLNAVLLKARLGASLEKKRLRDQQRELIRKFATAEVAQDLMDSGFELGGKYVDATAMFSDIRSFTSLTETLSPAEIIELLNTYYTLMFDAINGHGGVVNQMVGDGLMAIFGAPAPQPDHRQQAVAAALEMVALVALFNQDQVAQGKPPIRIGVGVASGQMIAGYTGTQNRATYTCVGDTVNLAARLEAYTKQVGHAILIDQNTQDGLDSGVRTEAVGPVQLKGKAQTVRVYAVRSAESANAV
jgi:class 3 adenylate cyclase